MSQRELAERQKKTGGRVSDGFDKRISEALEDDETFQGLLTQLREAASATTTVVDRNPSGCDKCGCKHFRRVEVPDYKLKLEIMKWLSERGVGRPAAVENGGDDDRIVFIREVRK